MLLMTTDDEGTARKSAGPPGTVGPVVISTIRIRSRVTVDPVVFCTRRRISKVPFGAFGTMFGKLRNRFGADDEDCEPSSNAKIKPLLSRLIGEARFSGPDVEQPPFLNMVAEIGNQLPTP